MYLALWIQFLAVWVGTDRLPRKCLSWIVWKSGISYIRVKYFMGDNWEMEEQEWRRGCRKDETEGQRCHVFWSIVVTWPVKGVKQDRKSTRGRCSGLIWSWMTLSKAAAEVGAELSWVQRCSSPSDICSCIAETFSPETFIYTSVLYSLTMCTVAHVCTHSGLKQHKIIVL